MQHRWRRVAQQVRAGSLTWWRHLAEFHQLPQDAQGRGDWGEEVKW